ncbi:MAG: 1-(5-phosphoribosyl)-5-[(5-phosphoribosylamino)methylideneamino]imidazole-4-carboxamide isomerase [Candidatus Omnitrophica bacterium]|nr:1-(5-phosphoribosyl)-5-[(5-phosphoribosylamino)methylideneamino]imidazole-4-carboxamide isomerase [Candidatus Omnitrophota bacterium]
MILIPAIDIKDGRVVRLFQGKFAEVTEYDQDPVAVAKKWESLGAQWLHVVDLDGAKTGAMQNQDVIAAIAKTVDIPIEVGGGIRDEQTVEYLFSKAKVARVILATRAIKDRDFLKKILAAYGHKIGVSFDCSNGLVAERGWVSMTNIKAVDLAKELEYLGLQWMVYTDIARDGTLAGPNFEQLQLMAQTVDKINLIASGGIGTLDDVKKLASMKTIAAAITGKAIYEGTLDFQQALKVC